MRRTFLAIPLVFSVLLLAGCGESSVDGSLGGADATGADATTGSDGQTQPDSTTTTNLPAGAACTAIGQCTAPLACIGADEQGTSFVCGQPNAGGAGIGDICSTHTDCEFNACVNGACKGPRSQDVIVGTGGSCDWIDAPQACLEWQCLYEAGRTVCRHNDQPVPNGNYDWTCVDVNNGVEIHTVCRVPGEVEGGTSPTWNCTYSEATNTTVCTNDADLPTPRTPGNNGGTDFDWDCRFLDEGGGSIKICEREGGGPAIGCPGGNIEGMACTPDGTSVSGATVTVHYTDCAGNPATRTVDSDALGYWSFGGIPVGDWTVEVNKGPYSTTLNVSVAEDATTSLIEGSLRSCFDRNATKIAVVGGAYDDIGSVLTSLGFTFDYYNGNQSLDGWNFLLNANLVNTYDIIFINCGVFPEEQFAARMSELQTIGSNLRAYVESGHYIYTSDWAYYFLEAAFPDKIDFRGDDLRAENVFAGQQGEHAVAVTDPELAAYTGLQASLINLDLPYWAIAESSAADTKVFLRGDARLVNGEVLSDIPFLVDFRAGAGSAVFTSYHIHANQAVDDFFAFLALNFK